MPKRPSGRKEPVEIRLTLPSRFGYEKIAMEATAAVAKLMGFSASRIEDLRTAVSEACINAMEHGNKLNALSRIEVLFYPGRRALKVQVHDNGCGFERVCGTPSLERKLAGAESPRGWGLFIIERLVDRVHFETVHEMGHVTTLTINLPRAGVRQEQE